MTHSALIDLSSVRVLCVDDDPVMRSVLRTALQRRGCRDVVQANGGMDALDLCAGRTFDLIVCDVQMQRMSGLDFLRALAASGLGAGWPVIMLTADTNPATIQEAQDLGVTAWVGKPVSMHTLIDRISGVLRDAGQIGGTCRDGELQAVSERYHARLMATLTTARDAAHSMSFRAREAASIAHGMRQILDNIDEHARTLGYGLIALLAGRSMDLVMAMTRNPVAAARDHLNASLALTTLFTAMQRVAMNRMEGDGSEGGLRLLAKIDGIVDGVRAGMEQPESHPAGTTPRSSAISSTE